MGVLDWNQLTMQLFVFLATVATVLGAPAPQDEDAPVAVPYIHEEIAAEPYVHEEPVETAEIAAVPYTHEDIAAEAYVHEEPVETAEIAAEPYVHMEPVAAPVSYAAP